MMVLSGTPRERRWSWRWFLRPRNAVLTAVGLFLLIQLVPVWLFQTNPAAQAEPHWDSPATRALAQQACFDCHSGYTTWPWYSKIAPASWLVTFDVYRGRRHLNFSDWHSGPRAAAIASQVQWRIQSGDMPPSYYILLHPKANLSAADKQRLIEGLQRSLR